MNWSSEEGALPIPLPDLNIHPSRGGSWTGAQDSQVQPTTGDSDGKTCIMLTAASTLSKHARERKVKTQVIEEIQGAEHLQQTGRGKQLNLQVLATHTRQGLGTSHLISQDSTIIADLQLEVTHAQPSSHNLETPWHHT